MILMLLGQAGLTGDPQLGADLLAQAHAIAAGEMPVHAAETSRLHGELLWPPCGDLATSRPISVAPSPSP
jgi:hypothetical protein